jgi:LuxR family transcriptional regulator, maltose regulon positive regulatory protein
MGTQLLSTKLFIPQPNPGLVARPRLLSRLEGILNYKLTLVSAQAGFGKTTIVLQWLHHHNPPIPTAWLSIEEADNEPVRFWEYIIAALKALFQAVGDQALVLLHSSQPVPIESTLTTLINDLVTVNTNLVLVLDDYQYIQNDAIHNGITFLIDHLPTKMHLFITTRVDPPLSLSSYRGKGTLLEIRAEDLRFTTEEAVSLLNEMEALHLSVEDVTALNDRADGWVVGLKMAGLAMRGQKNSSSFITGFTGNQRYIMDYLLDEVLERQPRMIYDFLLQTSVLDRLNNSLCNAVTQGTNSQETILYLERVNLFLMPLDTTGEWFRYHNLFRDLLQHRLQQESGDEGVKSAHRRASAWYEENHFTEEAINHTLAAQDWDKAMDLIGTPEIQARWVGKSTMLLWLQQVPLDILRTRLMRYINYVFALVWTGRQDTARPHLEYLEKLKINDACILGEVFHLHSTVALIEGEYEKVEEYARRALELFNQCDSAYPDKAWQTRISVASASQNLGSAYFNQIRFAEAEPFFEKCLKTYREVIHDSSVCWPAAMLGNILSIRGRPRDAIKIIQEAIRPFPGDPATSFGHDALARIYYDLNDLKSAAFHFEQCIKMIQLSKNMPTTSYEIAFLNLAQAKMAMRDLEGARQALDEADRILPDKPDDIVRNAAFHYAIALMQGDTELASQWLHKFMRNETVLLMSMPVVAIYQFRFRNGRVTSLSQLTEEREASYKSLTSQGLWGFAIIPRIFQALSLSDDTEKAMGFLTEALTLGKSQECIRTFVDFGAPMASLLREAIGKGIEKDYARRLLDITEDEERWRQSNRVKTRMSSQTAGILSKREVEVLRLLSEDLSYQQIADRLKISLNTTRTHIQHIYSKLEAKHRMEVVTRAKELKLI